MRRLLHILPAGDNNTSGMKEMSLNNANREKVTLINGPSDSAYLFPVQVPAAEQQGAHAAA